MLTRNLRVFPTKRELNGASHRAEGVQLELDDSTKMTFLPGMGPFPPDDAPAGESGLFWINSVPDRIGLGLLTLGDENPSQAAATFTFLDTKHLL